MSVTTTVSRPSVREDRLVEAMMDLARATMRVLRREATGTGLSMPQGHLLSWLAREGSQPTAAWAHRIGTSPSTTSELVDGLEEMGLIRRARSPTDRRQVRLEITSEGRRLSERIRAGQRAQLRERLQGIPVADLEETVRVVTALTERLVASEVPHVSEPVRAARPDAAHRPARRPRGGRGRPSRPHSTPTRRSDA